MQSNIFLSCLIFIGLLGFSIKTLGQDFSSYLFTRFDTSNSPLETDHIRDILFDEKGGAYIATSGLMLYYFDGNQWTFLEHPDLVKAGWFNDLEWGKEGRIWIAGSKAIVRYHPETKIWDAIPCPEQSFHMDRNSKGVFIYGGGGSSSHGGFRQWTGRNWQPVDHGHQDVLGIYICQNDDALVSYREGTWRYPMDKDGFYDAPSEKISDMAFYEFDENSLGQLWGASYSELKLHSREKDHWITHKGVPARMKYPYRVEPSYTAHNVLVLPDDRVIVTTQFRGFLAVYDGKEWEAFGLPILGEYDGVERIVQHPDGSLWCATWGSGLIIFHPEDQLFTKGMTQEPR